MRRETLVRNGKKVDLLSHSIRDGIASLDNIPPLIRQVIEHQMWQEHFHAQTGRISRFDSFQEFVETDPPQGLGTTVAALIRLCADDPLVVDLIDEVVQLTARDLIAITPYTKSKDGDDKYTFKKHIATGTSRQAGLRKLRHFAQSNPQGEQLRQAVLAGEMSVNKALIEAGLRTERITITRDPEKAAEVLKRSFNREELKQLIRYLRG